MTEPAWQTANRANWNERVPLHLASPDYDLAPLRAGRGSLHAIEAAELGPVAGLRVLHLQCHFGRDSLILAQQGAEVVGLDFSGPAIAAAQALGAELNLSAKFVCASVYDAPDVIGGAGSFDLVYVTWGTLVWLPDVPDVAAWARVVAHFLKPDGRLYFAEHHTAASVFDDEGAADGKPGWCVPYFGGELQIDDTRDYADATAVLANSRTHQFMHPLSTIVGAVLAAGLTLDSLHGHARVPSRMFNFLVPDADGLWAWPDRPWLPLAFSLQATRRAPPPH